MSKNTGTSELINYFDLGVNGDVGIAGSLDINTIANATTDTDTFLVSDTGIIKYRTGAQLLSDIGAAPAVAGGYVPYTGATTNVDLGVYNLTASAIIANGSGSNAGIVHLESNAIHSLVNGYGSIASGTTNQFNLYQTTGAGVFRGAILSLNSITEFATRTFTLPDTDGTIALTSQIPANPVGGTGTANYLPKFTGASTIGNSQIYDTGSEVRIFTTSTDARNFTLGVYGVTWDNTLFEIANEVSVFNKSSADNGDIIGFRTVGLQRGDIRASATSFTISSRTNLIFGSNNTDAMFLFSTGNLLVGTPSPISDNGARLQVSGTGNVTNSTSGNALIVGSTYAGGRNIQIGISDGSILPTASAYINDNTGVGVYIGDNSASTKGLYVKYGGSVGIGTTSPGFALDVHSGTAGSIINLNTTRLGGGGFAIANNGSARLYLGNANWMGISGESTSSTAISLASAENSAIIFATSAATTANERMRITSSGNVGIGTTSPTDYSSIGFTTLHINGRSGTGGGVLRLTSFDASCGVNIYAQSNAVVFNTTTASPFSWLTQDVTRMTLTSGGSLGINNTSPVNTAWGNETNTKQLSIDATTYAVINLQGSTGRKYSMGVGDGNFYMCYDNTAARHNITVSSSGNVSIGTQTDSGSKLRVSGGSLQIDGGFQRMYTYYIIVQPNTTGTITISSPTGTNMQGSMQVMAGGYGNSLSGNVTGLWMVGGLLFFNNASTSTITQIVNSVTANGSMSFQRSSDQYTVTLANTSSTQTKTLYVSVIINGE